MNFQTAFIALLAGLWITVGSWYIGNMACQGLNNLTPLQLQDGELGFKSQDHFEFGLSSSKLTLGPSTREFLADISGHLKSNPNKGLELNGLYLSEELNNSQYGNLGVARAAELKDQLIKLGAPEKQLRVNSQTLAINPMLNNVLYDGVGMNFYDASQPEIGTFDPTDESAMQAVEFVEPMTLYGDAIYSLDVNPSLQHYIDKIKAYLAENEEATLQIVGHSHDWGSIVKNKSESAKKANRVRRFFRNSGIAAKRIDPQPRGATEPILAPNMPNAKDKNNRVEIRIAE